MALVTEDGTGKADAEAYVSVSSADQYFALRNVATWTGDDATKEAAIRKATDYLDATYAGRWKGDRAWPSVQALAWPRTGVWLEDVGDYLPEAPLPVAVIRSTAELALIALGSGLLTAPADPSRIVVEEEVAGAIRTKYEDVDTSQMQRSYPLVEKLLVPYLAPASLGFSVQTVRV